MKKEHDDGGMAYPALQGMNMTLLDWLAGQALSSGIYTDCEYISLTVELAYDIAEAMIAEKRRREGRNVP